MIKGSVSVSGQRAEIHQLVKFNNDEESIKVEAFAESVILFGHALPFNEPIIAQGPFVMNTEQEIRTAYEDYRKGAFGIWED
ncbi:MAG: pirin-like C-terminal cupin domain-containing protein [Sphingobacteriaceae bacterium]